MGRPETASGGSVKPDPPYGNHLTDEQLVAGLYGLGSDNDHLRSCDDCKSRQACLVANRRAIEGAKLDGEEVSLEFLAIQRRAVCGRLDARESRWAIFGVRRWAPALLAIALLAGATA